MNLQPGPPWPWQLTPGGRTQPLVLRDYPEWHRGRRHYGVWLLELESEPLQQRMQRLRAQLAPWLLAAPGWPRRQAHVTVFVCGFWAPWRSQDDDFTPAQLAAQQTALASARLPPLKLEIGLLDSFDTAAFLRVHDPLQGLAAVRRVLGAQVAEIRQTPYVPHVTLGWYARAVPTTQVARRLAAQPPLEPLQLVVSRLVWARYEARVMGGRLTPMVSHLLQKI